MKLIRCVNGHFYDMDKQENCPYCVKIENERSQLIEKIGSAPVYTVVDDNISEANTVAMPTGGDDTVYIGSGGTEAGNNGFAYSADEPVTVGIFSKHKGQAYVSGWLVCVEGVSKGRDYRISHGMNWIGRSPEMDICMQDPEIAYRKHCAIVYDDRSNRFYIVDGEVGLTYVNNDLVEKTCEVKLGDILEIGKSKFEFIPFCREGHVWKIEE